MFIKKLASDCVLFEIATEAFTTDRYADPNTYYEY